jgi:FixJ family two-component response regulator
MHARSTTGTPGRDSVDREQNRDRRRAVATVFLIESELKANESLSWILNSAGFNVARFERGHDFLETLSSEDRGCVVVNRRLSDVEATTVLETLARKRIEMPVVLYGGRGNSLSVVQPIPAGTIDPNVDGCFGLAMLDRITRAMEIGDAIRSKRGGADRAKKILGGLTRRELEIAQRLARGDSNRAVGADLGISDRTVEVHRSHIMRKTESSSLADLVWLFSSCGLGRVATVWPVDDLLGHLQPVSC